MDSKGICLVSGGIDSPIAAHLMSKKMDIIPLYFSLGQYSSNKMLSITLKTLERLHEKTSFAELIIFPFGKVLKHIFKNLDDERYACIFCRKAMFKTASRICSRKDASSIVTGESLGQKASQTLENLRTTSFNIKYPIYRHLIGLDKEEIVEESKNEKLFFKKHAGCCNATPEKPRTKSNPLKIEAKFDELDLKEKIEEEMENLEIIDLEETTVHKASYDYLKKIIKTG